MKPNALLLVTVTILLSACDQIGQQLGLDEPQRREAKADAEGKAVGSACRQSGRAIEDCYSLYQWLPKASIFAGWREMNDYMQANNLGVVEPRLPPAGPDDKKKKARTAISETEMRSVDKKASAEATDAKPDGKTPADPSADAKKDVKPPTRQ